ncbi:MAG: tetratricopeptide repeat protein [Cyanobacteria bacterium J06621_8]
MSDSDFTIPISKSADSYAEGNTEYGYKAFKAGELLSQRFLIVRELGSGGFATTYLAKDQKSIEQRKCVVKQLQPRFNDPTLLANAKERLGMEAMVLQWLGKYSQIPSLIGYFTESEQYYLVLEFIEGEEFEQEIQRQVLNEPQAIKFLFDILEILQSVHQQGIIHRDIKPSNLIRRSRDGKMILIDFGAVKEIGALDFDASEQKLRTQIIGTPGYMPPEQNSGSPIYSSDLYALGKTVIFAMTGKSPSEWEFSESGEVVAWNKKIAISEALLKIVNCMTTENMAQRYQNAKEVMQELQPLKLIDTNIGGKYRVVKYLGGEQTLRSYVAESLGQNKSRYYLEIIDLPSWSKSDLSQTTQKIITELTNLSTIDQEGRVPKIIEYLIDKSRIYIVQEYMEGFNLGQLVDDQLILTETKVIEIVIDAANALSKFHRHQVIHGNIKPGSLIRRSGDAKISLVDFGLIRDVINLQPTSQGGYVAPEQIADRATYTSDIYALGMSAIHLLTGTSPQNLDKNPRTGELLWHRKGRISPGLAKIIDKMVCLDKNRRYQTFNRVVRDLNRIKHHSKFKGIFKYLLITSIATLITVVGLAQWRQGAAMGNFAQGDLKLKEKQYQQAIAFYDQGLNKLPNNKGQIKNFEQVWLKKAKAQRKLPDLAAALETCSIALKFYQSPQLWNCQALAFYSLENYDSAIAAYTKAIEIAPQNIWLWNNRGEAYGRLEEFELAVTDFMKAIELDSKRSFVPWNNLGRLYYQQQDYDQAIQAYNKALDTKPEYLPALIGLGNAQKASGLYEPAMASYDQALAINPEYGEAWFGKGSVAEYLRDDQAAREFYQRALELKPDWSAAQRSLTRVETRLGI